LNKEEIIEKIIPVFRTVFEDENLEIDEKSNSDNVNGWDSLNHIYLVVAIEEQFNIKFLAEDIQKWDNVGDMAEYISNHV
jgi:acyl carrier protein